MLSWLASFFYNKPESKLVGLADSQFDENIRKVREFSIRRNKEAMPHVVFLLDSSNTMTYSEERILYTANLFLLEIKNINPNSTIGLYNFNSTLNQMIPGKSVSSIYPLKEFKISQNLGSSLFDSVGDLLDRFVNNGHVMFIVLTSGTDTLSHNYTLETISKKISKSNNEIVFAFNAPFEKIPDTFQSNNPDGSANIFIPDFKPE